MLTTDVDNDDMYSRKNGHVLMSKISCALPVVQPLSKVQHIRHKYRMHAGN